MGYEVLCLIIKDSIGSQVLKTAKKQGMQGGTVFYGVGASQSKVWKMLGLDELRKECLFFVSDQEKVAQTLEVLTERYELDKPNHGIAFTVSLTQLLGAGILKNEGIVEEPRKERKSMTQAIFVIVERGKSEDVLVAAKKAGSTGGTVIHARGSGAEEKKRFFHMDIEPEKDIVLILANDAEAEKISEEIREDLRLDEPNSGVLFQMDVNETRGLAE